MKTCPYCAETDLQDAAIVCKHCGREQTAEAKPAGQTTGRKRQNLIPKLMGGALIGLVLLAVISHLSDPGTGPRHLTPEHLAAIDSAHRSNAWIGPKEVRLTGGIVVVDYEYASTVLIPAKTLGETRLLAIREALLPFGFRDYRVNVNGPSPGTGLVARIGSARFLESGGRLEWLTP